MSGELGSESRELSGSRAILSRSLAVVAAASGLVFFLLVGITGGGLGPDPTKLFDSTTTFLLTVGSLSTSVLLFVAANLVAPFAGDRRRTAIALAQERGLSYADEDPELCALPLEQFSTGQNHRCRNVLSGHLQEISVQVCDLTLTKWGRGDTLFHLSETCAVAQIPAASPRILIEARRTSDVESQWVQGDLAAQIEIPLADADFDRAYRVQSSDERFARRLLSYDGMRTWVLEEPRWNWEISGRNVACWRPQSDAILFRTASQCASALDAIVGFVKRLPDLGEVQRVVREEQEKERTEHEELLRRTSEEDESMLDGFKRGERSVDATGDYLLARYHAADSDSGRERYMDLLSQVDFERAQRLRMDDYLRPRSPEERGSIPNPS